jgi:Ala-tRNA(Pro) deacylase
MIPGRIAAYLGREGVEYRYLPHPWVARAEDLAASLHVPPERVAKCVLIEAEARRYMAVLPANQRLDEAWAADLLHARSVHLLAESELAPLFPDCEVGAEPPFGRLFDMSVVLDASLADRNIDLVFNAGTHTDAIAMRFIDFERIERPMISALSSVVPAPLKGTEFERAMRT